MRSPKAISSLGWTSPVPLVISYIASAPAPRHLVGNSLHLVDALSCIGAQYCFLYLDMICTVEEDGHFSWPPHCATVTQPRTVLASVSARTHWLAPVQPTVHQEPHGLCCRAASQSVSPSQPFCRPTPHHCSTGVLHLVRLWSL